MPELLVIFIICYLLGSVPSGLLISKFCNAPDPREGGSQNVGATNAWRTGGKLTGLLTFLGDFLKGFLPTLFVAIYWPKSLPLAICALVLGHIYSVFLRFRGGKGVATAFGIFAGISPLLFGILALLWAGIVWRWRLASQASLTAVAAAPLLLWLLGCAPINLVLALAGIAVLVFWAHYENILRLWHGKEKPLKF